MIVEECGEWPQMLYSSKDSKAEELGEGSGY